MLQEVAELVNANVRIAENATQGADRHSSAFVNRHRHPLIVGRAPQVQVTTTLTLFFKAGVLEGADQLLAVYSREFVAHAGAGTAKRVTKKGSCSTGMDSPSCCMPSIWSAMASAMLARASSSVSPNVWQPGKAGTYA